MIRYLWQLPQHLLALLLIFLFRRRIVSRTPGGNGTIIIRFLGIRWGVSLGQYVLIDSRATSKTSLHEQGHSHQSLMLGPLYLIAVGVPSITMNILTRLKVLRADRYYDRWPESWADSLGKVERVKR